MSVNDIGPLALEVPNALIETLAQRVASERAEKPRRGSGDSLTRATC
jgi:hypothetical protein